MLKCQDCGAAVKGGFTPTLLLQKSTGLTVCGSESAKKAEREWVCPACLEKHRG